MRASRRSRRARARWRPRTINSNCRHCCCSSRACSSRSIEAAMRRRDAHRTGAPRREVPRPEAPGAAGALLSRRALGMLLALGVPLALGMLLAPAARARDIPYGEVRDPAVQRCDALNWSPQHAAAADCYRALAQGGAGRDGAALAAAAEGAWALGDLKRANTLFQAAAAARPRDA